MGITIVKHYDYQFEYTESKIQENDTTEQILVKQELENDFENEGTVFVDVIDCKKEETLPSKRLLPKRLAKKRLPKERVKDNKKQSSKEFQTVMLTDERLPSKRLSKDKSKDTKNDLTEEFQTVTLTDEGLTGERLSKDKPDVSEKFEILTTKILPSKRLSAKRSKDTPDSQDRFETVVLTEHKSEPKRLPVKRLSIKRSSPKTSRDTPDVSDKFEMITLTDEEVSKGREEKRNHHNYKKLPFKCDYCVLGFTKKEYYDSHMTMKHDEVWKYF